MRFLIAILGAAILNSGYVWAEHDTTETREEANAPTEADPQELRDLLLRFDRAQWKKDIPLSESILEEIREQDWTNVDPGVIVEELLLDKKLIPYDLTDLAPHSYWVDYLRSLHSYRLDEEASRVRNFLLISIPDEMESPEDREEFREMFRTYIAQAENPQEEGHNWRFMLNRYATGFAARLGSFMAALKGRDLLRRFILEGNRADLNYGMEVVEDFCLSPYLSDDKFNYVVRSSLMPLLEQVANHPQATEWARDKANELLEHEDE